MPLTLGVPRETQPGERRVALVPEVVARLVKKGFAVHVEQRAGEESFHDDGSYRAAGAEVVSDAYGADVVLKVAPPTEAEVTRLKPGGVLVGFLQPLDAPHVASVLSARGVTAFSMELVPRISRAQKMDALSAMSSLAGYRAVVLAAEKLPKFFPLLTTAAGTIRPASVLVLGAGVAGLQAIATARRLGGRVSAYDVREAAKEEVQSLGATFVTLDLGTGDMQDAGGYAKALAEDQQRRQVEELAKHISQADVVITTALIPGRRAPLLVSEAAVAAMAPGSVIVDLAAPNGGNCALTRAGETVVSDGVTILGPLNLPSEMPVHSSMLYARTVQALLELIAAPDGLKLDFEDEIISGACLTHGGEVVHPRVKGILESAK